MPLSSHLSQSSPEGSTSVFEARSATPEACGTVAFPAEEAPFGSRLYKLLQVTNLIAPLLELLVWVRNSGLEVGLAYAELLLSLKDGVLKRHQGSRSSKSTETLVDSSLMIRCKD